MIFGGQDSLILGGIDDFDLIEILFLGLIFIGSAVANGMKKSAEKKRQIAAKEERARAGTDKAPSLQRMESRRYQRLPYAKIADTTPPQREVERKVSAFEPTQRPAEQPPAAAIIAQLAASKRTSYPPPKKTGPSRAVPQKSVEQTATASRAIRKESPKSAKKAEPRPYEPNTKINNRFLRQMLKNPDQTRYLIVASEILGKPLALR